MSEETDKQTAPDRPVAAAATCSRLSDTPETDRASYLAETGTSGTARVVLAEFAKTLERERDEAREELESHAWEISPAMAEAKINELNARCERLEVERAQLEAALMLAAQWGISSDGYSAEVAGNIRAWIIGGMKGPAPKAPDYYPENSLY